jgi:short-subunit dehydrogenase
VQELGAASASSLVVDVRDASAVEAAVAEAHGSLGRLDVVVNSAGVAAYGRFEEVPAEIFDAVLATNVQGSANVARAVLPIMRAADHGHLYLVGSITGAMGVPQMSAYVVSKWAIRALARSLQLESRDRSGMTVTLVTPGGVDTPIYALAANFQGRPGKPPPPIYSPESVARAIVRSLDRPPRRLSVGVTNDVMALGFALLPRVYDVLVGPLFGLLTQERGSIEPTTGNVLDPVPDGHALHGRHAGLSRLRDRIRHLEL